MVIDPTGTLTSLLLRKCQREHHRSVNEADRERSFARRFSKGPAPLPFRFALCRDTILYSDLASGISRHLSVKLIQVNERETANVRCSRRCRNETSFSPFCLHSLSLSFFLWERTVTVPPFVFGETRWFLDEERWLPIGGRSVSSKGVTGRRRGRRKKAGRWWA